MGTWNLPWNRVGLVWPVRNDLHCCWYSHLSVSAHSSVTNIQRARLAFCRKPESCHEVAELSRRWTLHQVLWYALILSALRRFLRFALLIMVSFAVEGGLTGAQAAMDIFMQAKRVDLGNRVLTALQKAKVYPAISTLCEQVSYLTWVVNGLLRLSATFLQITSQLHATATVVALVPDGKTSSLHLNAADSHANGGYFSPTSLSSMGSWSDQCIAFSPSLSWHSPTISSDEDSRGNWEWLKV